MTAQSFREDGAHVLALREFLASPPGMAFVAALKGEHPMVKLTTPEASRPAMVRGLAKAEGESAENLLGKITGYELALRVIESLVEALPDRKPRKKSAAPRIAPEPL